MWLCAYFSSVRRYLKSTWSLKCRKKKCSLQFHILSHSISCEISKFIPWFLGVLKRLHCLLFLSFCFHLHHLYFIPCWPQHIVSWFPQDTIIKKKTIQKSHTKHVNSFTHDVGPWRGYTSHCASWKLDCYHNLCWLFSLPFSLQTPHVSWDYLLKRLLPDSVHGFCFIGEIQFKTTICCLISRYYRSGGCENSGNLCEIHELCLALSNPSMKYLEFIEA